MKRVLFVCVENACRSQMAEGFFNASACGKAVAQSAGNMPAREVNPLAVSDDGGWDRYLTQQTKAHHSRNG